MTLTIKFLKNTENSVWDAYVLSHPDGTLFHLSKWKSVVEKSFGHKSHYLMATTTQSFDLKPQTSVVGVLPLFHIKSKLFGKYIISVPFAELGGVLADNYEVEKALLTEVFQLAQESQCDYLELRHRNPVDGLPTKDLYVNFRRKIHPDLNENLMAIPRKARRMIRQGEKHGLSAEFGLHQLDGFYDIVCRSYRHLGTPIFSKSFFENFIDTFGEQCQILMISTKDGKPAAGVLSFFFKDQVLPYYAGSEFEYRRLAPNDFMYWQLMKYGCEKGYKVFDYGRSKVDTGSYHFKRHWGFDPTPLAYQYHLVRADKLPNLSPTNPKYKKKIEAWRKLPLWVTRMIGPPIAKYLG